MMKLGGCYDSVLQFTNRRLAKCRDLIQAPFTVNHHGALRSKITEDVCQRLGEPTVKNTDHLSFSARGIRQGTQDIEDSAHSELPPNRSCILHRTVHHWGEQE